MRHEPVVGLDLRGEIRGLDEGGSASNSFFAWSGFPMFEEHVSLERVVERHGPDVAGLLVPARTARPGSRAPAPPFRCRRGRRSRRTCPCGARRRCEPSRRCSRARRPPLLLSLIQESHRDPLIRVEKVRIDRERLAVLGDGVVEAAHLQKQLGVRIVGIGIVRDQLDVPLERLLGVGELVVLTIGVAHEVVRGRERVVDLGGLLIVLDGLRVVLLAEEVAGEIEVRPLVVGIAARSWSRYCFCWTTSLFAAASVARIRSRSPSETLSASAHGFLQMLEELLAVGAESGEASSASAKFGSSAIALGKCSTKSDQGACRTVAALDKLGLRLRRRRRHGDLAVVGRRGRGDLAPRGPEPPSSRSRRS